MLILTRREDESCTIGAPNGDLIEIRVCATRGGRVRLGFTAPKGYSIGRTPPAAHPAKMLRVAEYATVPPQPGVSRVKYRCPVCALECTIMKHPAVKRDPPICEGN